MGLAPGLRVRTWHLVAVVVIAVGAVVAALALNGWGPLGTQHATLVSAHKASTTESLNPAKALGVTAEESSAPAPSAYQPSSTTTTASHEMDDSSSSTRSTSTESDDTESSDDHGTHATPSPTAVARPTPSATATAMPSPSPTPHDE
jgi:hypothetical protein